MGQVFLTHVSGTFCFVPPTMASFLLHRLGFLELCASDIYCLMPLASASFLLHMLGFLDSRTLDIFCHVPSAITSFFLCRSGFLNSHISSIFCLVPPTMVGFLDTHLKYILFCASHHFGLLSCFSRWSSHNGHFCNFQIGLCTLVTFVFTKVSLCLLLIASPLHQPFLTTYEMSALSFISNPPWLTISNDKIEELKKKRGDPTLVTKIEAWEVELTRHLEEVEWCLTECWIQWGHTTLSLSSKLQGFEIKRSLSYLVRCWYLLNYWVCLPDLVPMSFPCCIVKLVHSTSV